MANAYSIGAGLLVLLVACHGTRAQELRPPAPSLPLDAVVPLEIPPPTMRPAAAPGPAGPGSGLEPESLPAEINEDYLGASGEFRLGTTPVSEVGILMNTFGLRDFFGDSGYRVFG